MAIVGSLNANVPVSPGFLSSALAEKAISRLTKRLGITYASSEIGTPVLVSRFATTNDMHRLAADEGRMIQIVDERGNECPEGELRILLTNIDDEEASVTMFRGEFFYPGDMAVRRADGRIRILGRIERARNKICCSDG